MSDALLGPLLSREHWRRTWAFVHVSSMWWARIAVSSMYPLPPNIRLEQLQRIMTLKQPKATYHWTKSSPDYLSNPFTPKSSTQSAIKKFMGHGSEKSVVSAPALPWPPRCSFWHHDFLVLEQGENSNFQRAQRLPSGQRISNLPSTWHLPSTSLITLYVSPESVVYDHCHFTVSIVHCC